MSDSQSEGVAWSELQAEAVIATHRYIDSLESQIATTADFLNTCLRESNLDSEQVKVGNLKPGIDALYFSLGRARHEARTAERNLRLEIARRESAHKFIEAIEMAVEGHLPYGYTQDDATAVGKVFRLVQDRNSTHVSLAQCWELFAEIKAQWGEDYLWKKYGLDNAIASAKSLVAGV